MTAEAIQKLPALWLFDFDRTLAILEPVVDWAASRSALEAELRSSKLPPSLLDELIAAIPRGNLPLYEALRARLLDSPQGSGSKLGIDDAHAILARASSVIELYEIAGVDEALPMAGAQELPRALVARHATCAVVTSNSSRTVALWLARHGLNAIFRVIVGRDSLLALKPSPRMVQRAIELCAPGDGAEAVFVGDSPADVGAAAAAKVSFLGIAADTDRRTRLMHSGAAPERLFDSALQLGTALGVLP